MGCSLRRGRGIRHFELLRATQVGGSPPPLVVFLKTVLFGRSPPGRALQIRKGKIMDEKRVAEQEMEGIIEGGLEKYKRVLMLILEMRMENLYGGHRDCLKWVRGNDEDAIKIWDEAVEQCIKIVKEK